MQTDQPVAQQRRATFRGICGVRGAVHASPGEIALGGNLTLQVQSDQKRAAEGPATDALGGETS